MKIHPLFKIKSISKALLCLIFLSFSSLIFAQTSERNLASEEWKFVKEGDTNWLPASIPGTIHTDLFQNKIIPDPFFGANEKKLQWIEEENWIYQTGFSISEAELSRQNIVMQFDGLDTYATVFLNGTKILDADNMFRIWKVDVKKTLKIGKNELKIVFASAVKRAKDEAKKLPYILPGDEKVFARKAQYHFGWDWGPRFATAGIWKKVSLNFWDKAVFKNIHYKQKELNEKVAQLEFQFEIEAAAAGIYSIKMRNASFERKLKKGINTVSIPFTISDPILWWPNGMGVAHRYIFDFFLYHNERQLEKKRVEIGIRTIELIQEKDAAGKSFYFKVNGKPVFMKGANYIPPDSFLPKADRSTYQKIVKNAVDSNMNMLRVWGGGVYADDTFYDECDKNGILVWQDFMFACAMYPGDSNFLNNVKNEVIDNVSRLQNHPSIALWCGNNEIDEGWHNWGWQKQYNYSAKDSAQIWNNYQKLFHDVIPQTLSTLLPENENRYWPSSPSIGWGRKESLLQGDAHYWGVWWGKEPFEIYEKKVGRFMSEYGFQGMPDLKTIKAFASDDELNLQSESVRNHQKHPTGYETINEYMVRDYKIPSRFEDYIYVSQLLQADGMKIAIEAHRRAKPYCMGTLFWQLNDCWPVTSWSSVDYFERWKALQYQVKRSYENVLVSVQEEKESFRIVVINDNPDSIKGELKMTLIDFNGKQIWTKTQFCTVPENSASAYFEISKNEIDVSLWKKSLLSIGFSSEKHSSGTFLYFVKPKDLQLTKPNIKINKIDPLTIEITSDVLAKNVFLSSQQDVFFSDNFFDILPNQKIRITLSQAVESIEVKSLFDTLK